MDILQIMWIFALSISAVIGIIFLLLAKEDLIKWKNKRYYDKDVWSFLLIYIVIFIIVIAFFGTVQYKVYEDAHTLPYEWQAKQKAINDIEKYLMRYDNMTTTEIGSIGQGLEASELKKELANKRSELEEVETEMLQWINNPMSAYKTIMIKSMNNAGYYD